MTETVPPPTSVSSPCIGVCVLDNVTGLCRGCQRTGFEIAEWRDASTHRRLEILRSVAVRRARLQPRHVVKSHSRRDGPANHDG